MKIIHHIGLHRTDEDQALSCLRENAASLASRGVCVPPPDRSRPVIQKAMIDLRGEPAPLALQRQMCATLGAEACERLVLSNPSYLCMPKRALDGGELYPLAGERLGWIRNLFPGARTEFAIGLRNPAGLIPALHERFRDSESFGDLLNRIRPEEMSLVELVERMRDAVPNSPLIVWCNEDIPLIWPRVLDSLTDQSNGLDLEEIGQMPGQLMTEDGAAMLRDALASGEIRTRQRWQEIVSDLLSRFGLPERTFDRLDVPGWTQDMIGRLTAWYEEDLYAIGKLDGVRLIQPES